MEVRGTKVSRRKTKYLCIYRKIEKEVDGLCERGHENCKGDRRGLVGQS